MNYNYYTKTIFAIYENVIKFKQNDKGYFVEVHDYRNFNFTNSLGVKDLESENEILEEDDEEEYHMFEFLGIDSFNVNTESDPYKASEYFRLKSFDIKNSI